MEKTVGRNNQQPRGNIKKGLSYAEAWTRIKRAQAEGFFLEAITIEESIITDRLTSHLLHQNKLPKKKTFFDLLQAWAKTGEHPISDKDILALCQAIDVWRSDRNHLIHGLVKSRPGTPTQDVEDFLLLAKSTAASGAKLARAVCSWHQKQIRSARKAAVA